MLSLGVRGREQSRELTKIRCERGAEIARLLGFPDSTADAIRVLDEHWDGRGHPGGQSGGAIPLLARIACLSQTVDVFFSDGGLDAALDIATRRATTWFDPELVRVLHSFRAAPVSCDV